MPMVRNDMPDVVYRTEAEKFAAIIEDIKQRVEKGQPSLVGTVSIKKSELYPMHEKSQDQTQCFEC